MELHSAYVFLVEVLGLLGKAAHGLGQGTGLLQAVPPPPQPKHPPPPHTPACLIHQAYMGRWPHLSIFPWVEGIAGVRFRRLGYGGLSPQQLLEAQALSTRIGREGNFCLGLYSDRPSTCSCLGWGSERQPCSHTSCATVKALHPPQ
jgi:hypothetical protein